MPHAFPEASEASATFACASPPLKFSIDALTQVVFVPIENNPNILIKMEGGRGFQPPEIKNHQSPTTNETQAANNKVNITGAASESKYEGISTTDKVESDAKDPVLPIVYGTTANGNDVKGLDIKQGDRNGEEVVTSVRDEYLVSRLVLYSLM
jgi:hypothetical protein